MRFLLILAVLAGAQQLQRPNAPDTSCDIHPGTEVMVVYLGAESCGPCQDPLLKNALKELRRSSEERFAAQSSDVKLIGAALDCNTTEGLRFLSAATEFDEIAAGGEWSNTMAIQFLWSDPETIPAIPQLIVARRQVKREGNRHFYGAPVVETRLIGPKKIAEWILNGAAINKPSRPN